MFDKSKAMTINQVFVICVIFTLIIFLSVFYVITHPKNYDTNLVEVTEKPSVESETLVVILHAYGGSESAMRPVKETIEKMKHISGPKKGNKIFDSVTFLTPDLPFGALSTADPNQVAHEIMLEIDKAFEKKKYKEVVLVGYSMGAVFARKLYVLAQGETTDIEFGDAIKKYANNSGTSYSSPRKWASKVNRIVLLAGMNNGWSISHHMSRTKAVEMEIGTFLGEVVQKFHDRAPIIFSVKKDSKFLTELKLQWIAMNRNKKTLEIAKDFTVVQLLGTIDDLVPPTDNIDLVTGMNFQYIKVSHSGHLDVIQMDLAPDIDCKSEDYQIEERKLCSRKKGRAEKLREAFLVDNRNTKTEVEANEVEHVVFVIHGIRDEGYWTEKIAKQIYETGIDANKKFASVHSSYGYFPILGFLRPNAREEKVQWFLQNYVSAKSKYPNAKFHFVGHSHGTYIFSKALLEHPSIKFGNVVFAGSVVPTSYNWKKLKDRNQIEKVLNYTASNDAVVAWFPNALEILGISDLGGAGHYGFLLEERTSPYQYCSTFDDRVGPECDLINKGLVKGGHSAALSEDNWESIAEFVVNGEIEELEGELKAEEHHFLLRLTAPIAPVIWLLIATLIFYIGKKLLIVKLSEWKKTVLFLSYVFFLWTILTKF